MAGELLENISIARSRGSQVILDPPNISIQSRVASSIDFEPMIISDMKFREYISSSHIDISGFDISKSMAAGQLVIAMPFIFMEAQVN